MFSLASYPVALAIGTFTLGALHAFEPGHGKAALAAYFVGSKLKLKEALIASFATSVAHTVSILSLALIIQLGVSNLFEGNTSRDLETFFDHFAHAIGAAIILYGVYVGFRTLKKFGFERFESEGSTKTLHHAHSHACNSCESSNTSAAHSDHLAKGTLQNDSLADPLKARNWRRGALFGFGIGLIPCPTALAAYFSALSTGGAGSATATVVIFGLGIFSSFAALALILALSQKRFRKLSDRVQISAFTSDLLQASLLIAIGAFTLLRHSH